MFGSALLRLFTNKGYKNIITRTRKELDLRKQNNVTDFFNIEKPDIVILAAAKVGGIQANINHPAEFLYDNLMIQNNVIHQSHLHNVSKFCFLGSSCVYPKNIDQLIDESKLLTGPLEKTNEGYALAKISGIKMVELYHKQFNFPGISVMPCNLYGPNDSFDSTNSHVLSALVKKFTDALDNNDKKVTVWGTGTSRREFMHVDDAAEGVFFLLENYSSPEIINLGWGLDISIKELATLIAKLTGYTGEILWDTTKPDGIFRKCLDVSKINSLGYKPKIDLTLGVLSMIQEYKKIKQVKL